MRYLVNHTNSSCFWIVGYISKKEGLLTKTKRDNWQKKKEQREERNHRPSVGKERITYDIRIRGHNALPSKAIRIISIDGPRKVWRVNEHTSNKLLLLQVSTLKVMTNKVKEREKKKKRLSIYLSSKGRHEAGDVELFIVQPHKKSPDVGNTTPP